VKVYYAGETLPEREDGSLVSNSIFLAGPTPREAHIKSWRPEALKMLEEMGFDGHVFVPETSAWGWLGNYAAQLKWEWGGLGRAACVLFWIPRSLTDMPGYTTNVEFGTMMAFFPHRVVLGAPPGTPKMRYLQAMATHVHAFHNNFNSTADHTRIPLQGTSLPDCLMLAVGRAGMPDVRRRD
jgi:hypothetical protein